jgi:hypothetical protein
MRNLGTCLRAALVLVLTTLIGAPASAAPPAYPAMAPIEQYRSASVSDEVALARSAAPPSISQDAEVLTLGVRGYDVAVSGKNSFACIVQRSWANDFGDGEFWNPKIRAPICFNPAAARSVLPEYLERTQWVLSGASPAQLIEREKAAIAAKEITVPETGAMCYMMSKQGYLGDDAGGPWHPHLMFFLPPTAAAQLGANLPGSPVITFPADIVPVSIFLVPVAKWSDGTIFKAVNSSV